MLCPCCGKEIPDNLSFCTECGAALNGSMQAQETAADSTDTTAASAPEQVVNDLPQTAEQVSPAPESTVYTQPENPGKTLGIISLVLGIISFTCCGSFVTGIVGIILGFMGRSKSKQAGLSNGMATAGLILSALAVIIALIALVIYIVMCIIAFLSAAGSSVIYY